MIKDLTSVQKIILRKYVANHEIQFPQSSRPDMFKAEQCVNLVEEYWNHIDTKRDLFSDEAKLGVLHELCKDAFDFIHLGKTFVANIVYADDLPEGCRRINH